MPSQQQLRVGSYIAQSTAGSMLFVDSSNYLAQNNASINWDDSANTLRVRAKSGQSSNLFTLQQFSGSTDFFSAAADNTLTHAVGTLNTTQPSQTLSRTYSPGSNPGGVIVNHIANTFTISSAAASMNSIAIRGNQYTLNLSGSNPVFFTSHFQITSNDNSSGNRDYFIGSYSLTYHQGAGTCTYLYSAACDIVKQGSGAITNAYGFNMSVGAQNASGTVTNAYGGYASVGSCSNSSTVFTNAFGYYIVNPTFSGGGSVTNLYGLVVENLTGGSTINRAIETRGGEVLHMAGTATVKALQVRAAASQSVDVQQWQDSTATMMSAIAKNGAFKPASLADASAENGTVYYSTTASKLVFKDSGGVVNNLH